VVVRSDRSTFDVTLMEETPSGVNRRHRVDPVITACASRADEHGGQAMRCNRSDHGDMMDT